MSPILLKLLEDFIIVHAKCNMFHTCNLEGKTQEYLQNNVEEHHQLLGCRLCLAQPQFVTRGVKLTAGALVVLSFYAIHMLSKTGCKKLEV